MDIKLAARNYEAYKDTNHNLLGRGNDAGKVSIDRDFLEESFRLLQMFESSGNGSSEDIKNVIHSNRDQLINLIFMSLPTVLEDVMKQADKVAHDLLKEAPHVIIDMNDILISYKQEQAIKNCFVHLLRNSLDHGIEDAEVRKGKGKTPEGTITLSASENEDTLTIYYEDDGAGLAIGKLREKGLREGLIDGNASVDDVAALIFNQGMSTAQSLSMISGRGVGMDAVRRFLEAENGGIEIVLGELLDPPGENYRFKFKITLPGNNNAVGMVS